jgi:hypothetical protein
VCVCVCSSSAPCSNVSVLWGCPLHPLRYFRTSRRCVSVICILFTLPVSHLPSSSIFPLLWVNPLHPLLTPRARPTHPCPVCILPPTPRCRCERVRLWKPSPSSSMFGCMYPLHPLLTHSPCAPSATVSRVVGALSSTPCSRCEHVHL